MIPLALLLALMQQPGAQIMQRTRHMEHFVLAMIYKRCIFILVTPF